MKPRPGIFFDYLSMLERMNNTFNNVFLDINKQGDIVLGNTLMYLMLPRDVVGTVTAELAPCVVYRDGNQGAPYSANRSSAPWRQGFKFWEGAPKFYTEMLLVEAVFHHTGPDRQARAVCTTDLDKMSLGRWLKGKYCNEEDIRDAMLGLVPKTPAPYRSEMEIVGVQPWVYLWLKQWGFKLYDGGNGPRAPLVITAAEDEGYGSVTHGTAKAIRGLLMPMREAGTIDPRLEIK